MKWTCTFEWDMDPLDDGYVVTPIINGVRLSTHWCPDRHSAAAVIAHDRDLSRLVLGQCTRDMERFLDDRSRP